MNKRTYTPTAVAAIPTAERSDAERLAALERQVEQLGDELARRDVEQIAMEGAIEFLLEGVRKLNTFVHYSARGIVEWLVSPTYQDAAMHALKPNFNVPERFPTHCTWRRPKRRWQQFGSLAELRERCETAGLEWKVRDDRETLIYRLWEYHQLPGSTHLFLKTPAERRALMETIAV
jgi:hypothetical protein